MALLRAIKALEKLKVHNDDQRTGIDIVKKALSWPARQIAINAGEDGSIEAAQTKFCGLQVEPQEQVGFQKGPPAGHPRFSAVCGGCICPFTVSVRKEDRSRGRFGAFRLWRPKTVSRRASKARPETQFACDRDRLACKNFERNWDTMVSSEL